MNFRLIITRLLALIVLCLISYGLTTSIAAGSWMGTILAIISLAATIIFLYLLPKLYQQPEEDDVSI